MGLIRRRDRERFERDGFIVLPLVDEATCREVRRAFFDEVKPFEGPLLRQLTSREEPHQLSVDGHMVNPVINPRLQTRFPRFSRIEDTLMEAAALVAVARTLLAAPPGLLQSVYVESSLGTLAHRDFNPLDRDRPMLGAWIALEDIGPDAGRFYLLPGSHRLPPSPTLDRYSELAWKSYHQAFVEVEASTAEDEAQRLLSDLTATHGLVREAPALRAGEVVFWSDRVLHGSHPPKPGGGTRNSVLMHFVEAELFEA